VNFLLLCPLCAQSSPGERWILLGAMIALPFAVAFFVVRAIVRAGP
jgi:hypothetical protein